MAVAFALATAMTIATYSVVDGVGIRASSDPFSYIAWLFILEGLVFSHYHSAAGTAQAVQPQLVITGLVGGVLAGMAYGLVLYAKTMAPLGMVSPCAKPRLFCSHDRSFLVRGRPGKNRTVCGVIVTLVLFYFQQHKDALMRGISPA